MSGGGLGGPTPPATNPGVAGVSTVDAVDDVKQVIPEAEDTSSYAIVANPNNSGIIYVGWDEDNLSATNQEGFPLAAGAGLNNEFNDAVANLLFTGDTAGDKIHYITVG